MELNIEIDNNKLKQFGLDGIFKQAIKQMHGIQNQAMFYKSPVKSELS